MDDLLEKKILVVGLGITGQAVCAFLQKKGVEFTSYDAKKNKELPKLADIDLAIVSPGVGSKDPTVKALQKKQIKMIGELEFAFHYLQKPLIAITGTNGKTTVCALVTHVLNHSRIAACAVGNIGVPLISKVEDSKIEVFVCEMSSYQLETLQAPRVDAGLILNITPDHLDRYNSMELYAAAKFKLASILKPTGMLFVQKQAQERFGTFPAEKISDHFYCNCCKNQEKLELLLPACYRNAGDHEVENLEGAYLLLRQMGISQDLFFEALKTFKKPQHRMEFVRNVKGVSYFNDSKGTNIDAVLKAVRSMTGPVVLIAGGLDKGSDFSNWLEPFCGKVKAVCLIGQAKEKIRQVFAGKIETRLCLNLDEAVFAAQKIAKEGENVLLSPGCASFDQFKDYAERGDSFKDIVMSL